MIKKTEKKSISQSFSEYQQWECIRQRMSNAFVHTVFCVLIDGYLSCFNQFTTIIIFYLLYKRTEEQWEKRVKILRSHQWLAEFVCEHAFWIASVGIHKQYPQNFRMNKKIDEKPSNEIVFNIHLVRSRT